MNANEIIKALRGACNQCNPTPCCEFEILGDEAADTIESLQKQLAGARNELCIKCGRYKESYLGACDGCRWERDY